MLSREQVLALMRERVHHPAGMRELLQTLKVPRDEHTSFKRHIKSLVAAGDLIVNEAGGRVTTREGETLVYNREKPEHKSIICAGLPLHARLLERMQEFRG